MIVDCLVGAQFMQCFVLPLWAHQKYQSLRKWWRLKIEMFGSKDELHTLLLQLLNRCLHAAYFNLNICRYMYAKGRFLQLEVLKLLPMRLDDMLIFLIIHGLPSLLADCLAGRRPASCAS